MIETLHESLKAIEKSFENVNWVSCPMCQMEWTKLRPCPFFVNEQKEWETVCVECAESLKSFNRISHMFPVKPPFENWGEDWIQVIQSSPTVIEGDPIPRTIIAKVRVYMGDRNSDLVFDWLLYPEGMGVVMYDAKERIRIQNFDNTFQAWLSCKSRIENWSKYLLEAKKIEKKSWGFNKMRCFILV